jgi:hypothetical protein
MGQVHVEQKRRQTVKVLPISPEAKAWKVRRTRAQEIARSRRRGNFGLAKAIMERKQ